MLNTIKIMSYQWHVAIKRSCNASQIIGDLFKKKLYYYRLVALIGLLSFTPFNYISNTKKKILCMMGSKIRKYYIHISKLMLIMTKLEAELRASAGMLRYMCCCSL